MKPGIISIALAVLLAAPAAIQGGGDEWEAREQAAMAVTQTLFEELSGALQSAMQEGGPPGAIGVCQDFAPQIAARLSRETGWRITRVGTRVRNPMLGMPDAWEQGVLNDFRERMAEGEPMQSMTHAEVVEEPDGEVFRFMRAIGTQETCLACHGTAETVHDGTFQALGEHYPHDRATGYRLGELRGAFSVKQPMD